MVCPAEGNRPRNESNADVRAFLKAYGLPAARISPFFLGHEIAAWVECAFTRAGRSPDKEVSVDPGNLGSKSFWGFAPKARS